MRVTRMGAADIALVAAIDRAEDVEREYEVVAGALVERRVTFPSVAPWDPAGAGPHSVATEVAFVTSHLDAGATLFGAFVDAADAAGPAGPVHGVGVAGLAVVQPCLEGDLAQLAFLNVSRPYRRRGVASALWVAAVEIARSADATALYVSATPTGSAVGFYLAKGCRLARPPHARLVADEPDDIHLVCAI